MDTVAHCPPAIEARVANMRAALLDAGADAARLARGADAALIVGALGEDETLALGTLLAAARADGVDGGAAERIAGE
ncbi:MAG: hypothetical protein KIT37_15390, partial [Steroidobacteraceae bacterium]|nr:hypothetical protein [Steroidobacteraceae bacterium]